MEIKDYGPLPSFDGGDMKEEIWLLVFLRSTVDSVARLRSVSRTWDALFSSYNFRQLYNRSVFLDENNDLVVACGTVAGSGRKKLLSLRKTPFKSYDVRLIGLPVCASQMILVGSCGGLLCLVDLSKNMTRIMLWNPGSAEEKMIEVPPTKSSTSTGIGYSNRNDFKVLRLVNSDEKLLSNVQLYSLNEDLWTDSISIPFFADAATSSFNIGGIPYWLGYDRRSINVICSINPANEVYEIINYPPQVSASNVYPVNLKDSVSALVVCNNVVDIYSFEESTFTWVKKITTEKLQVPLEWIRKVHCFKDNRDIVAFGWPDTEFTVNDVSNRGVPSHLSMEVGTDFFTADFTGPFSYTGTRNVIIPGGKKLLEAQPKPDGESWKLKRTKVNKVIVDVIEAVNSRSLGSYSEIALSPLAVKFRGNKDVSELALEELVHLSEQSDVAAKMVRMDMVGISMEMLCKEGVGFTKLLVKLLVNLTRLDEGVEALLKSCKDVKMHGLNVVKLVSLFNSSTNDIRGDAFEHAGSILVNISKSDAGRKLLLEPRRGLINQILKEFDSASPVRRKGVSGTIRNCCLGLEEEHHLENLLMASELLWPTLLLPIAGKNAYSEEETSKMPLELGSKLLVERNAVYDPEIQIEALEAVYLIALQERGRRALRSVNGELIMEVGAACEPNLEVMEAYEQVVSVLK